MMKIRIAPLLFLLAISIWQCKSDDELTAGCLPENLQDGLIAYYPFVCGSLCDATGNGNDLLNPTTAQPSSDREGNSNCAFKFNNKASSGEEYLTTNDTEFLNELLSLSIALWYQPIDTLRIGGSYEVLVARGEKRRCPNRGGEWAVGLYDCRRAVFGHNNSVWANLRSGPFSTCQKEVNTLTDVWHHVVAVKHKNRYEIYINGILNNSATGDANCNNLLLAEDIGDLFIGKGYRGKIDEVLLYDRSLTADEIVELYEIKPCCQ